MSTIIVNIGTLKNTSVEKLNTWLRNTVGRKYSCKNFDKNLALSIGMVPMKKMKKTITVAQISFEINTPRENSPRNVTKNTEKKQKTAHIRTCWSEMISSFSCFAPCPRRLKMRRNDSHVTRLSKCLKENKTQHYYDECRRCWSYQSHRSRVYMP